MVALLKLRKQLYELHASEIDGFQAKSFKLTKKNNLKRGSAKRSKEHLKEGRAKRTSRDHRVYLKCLPYYSQRCRKHSKVFAKEGEAHPTYRKHHPQHNAYNKHESLELL